jgi:hypothetical protein
MYLPFPAAYRSLSRPSSAPSAKAFALRPFSLDLFFAFEFLSLRELFFLSVFSFSAIAVFLPKLINLTKFLLYFKIFTSSIASYSVFKVHLFHKVFPQLTIVNCFGGLKWVRTIDLALIRRAL